MPTSGRGVVLRVLMSGWKMHTLRKSLDSDDDIAADALLLQLLLRFYVLIKEIEE